jgi:hypothetical protein
MKVFGFDPVQRLPVAIELDIEQVISHGIHPWIVDVFADQSSLVEVNGLQCRRLLPSDNLELFGLQAGKPFLYQRINGIPYCYSMDSFHYDRGSYSMHNVTTSKPRNPLALLQSDLQYARSDTKLKWWRPKSISHQLWETGDLNRFFCKRSGEDVHHYSYGGNTTHRIQVNIALPKAITWLLQAFARYKPEVFGGCLRDTLAGDNPHDIDFFIDLLTAEEIKVLLNQVGAEDVKELTDFDRYGASLSKPIFEFVHSGYRYHLICRGNFLADKFWDLTDFSVNQVIADRNGVYASRIALWDIAHKQLRVVSRNHTSLQTSDITVMIGHWKDRATKMRERGYQLLENPFATSSEERI